MATGWRTRLSMTTPCFLVLHVVCASQGAPGERSEEQPHLLGRRIIGGRAAESDLIWATHITKVGGDSKRCTGILVNSKWMLTAAHCLLNGDEDGYLSAPGTSITYGCLNIYDSTCKQVSASNFVPHPCYTPSRDQDHDDIALIELSEEVSLGEHEFPRVDGVHGQVKWEVGMEVTLAGFGITETGASSPDLLRVDVPLASQQTCETANPYAVDREYVNYECMFCTGGQAGKDSCNGDSGGPAIAYEGGKPWLVGILSVGSELPREDGGCAVEGRYGVYTFVRKYASFINTTIAGTKGLDDPCVCSSGSVSLAVVHQSAASRLLTVLAVLVASTCRR